MADSIAEDYDAIGDVYGYADKLEDLITALSYQRTDESGEYRPLVARPSSWVT
ncbi:hypothetical protein [Mycolicibacterium psychrotolerans]|uniref:Uncharacterized protein n=1 Tax=Mycolicibacterium psychrotolerans TaxID=216929 RepID=A0A7I7M356_9MYCO|nr:hypothetical protein [Mycolicibacterium psychrotolerans]BBX66594.1 hypothetical protein MPSYJ_00550 [Mycolicibacterium psychrotolerans]